MKPLVGKRMELAMLRRDSGGRSGARALYRSEGLSAFGALLCLSHFPSVRVNDCWERAKSTVRRWLSPRGQCYRLRSAGSNPTEESLRVLSSRAAPFLLCAGRPWRTACSASELSTCRRRKGQYSTCGRWRSYGFIRPVLKHGPRSLTCVRVFG